jgi:hypothetical protein
MTNTFGSKVLLIGVLALTSAGLASALPFDYCNHTGPTGTFTSAQFVASGCISGEKQGNLVPNGDGVYDESQGGDGAELVEDSIQSAQGLSNIELAPISGTIVGTGNNGTWSATTGVDYITVKAANGYALYDVSGATSGSWTTNGLLNNGNQQPGVSHVDLWQCTSCSHQTATPEPSMLLVLLSGMAGVVIARRRLQTGS